MEKLLFATENPESFQHWLDALERTHVVGKACSWEQLLGSAGQNEALDLILVDAQLLDDGEDSVKALSPLPGKKIIIGDRWQEAKQIQAIIAGICGYVEKNVGSETVCRVVDSVLKDEIWLQRHLIPRIIRQLARQNNDQEPHSDGPSERERQQLLARLTKRELDVAEMISQGKGNRSIAESLNISERTVKAHLTSIFRKLSVHDRMHLVLLLKG